MSNPKFCSRMILVADKYYGTKLETPETSRIYVGIGANDNGHFFTLISPSFGDVEGEKYCFINNDMYRNKTKTVFLSTEVSFQNTVVDAEHSLFPQRENEISGISNLYVETIDLLEFKNQGIKGKAIPSCLTKPTQVVELPPGFSKPSFDIPPLGQFDYIRFGKVIKCKTQLQRDQAEKYYRYIDKDSRNIVPDQSMYPYGYNANSSDWKPSDIKFLSEEIVESDSDSDNEASALALLENC